jgi:protein involved in polysaccharide export with SLBB domain
MLIALSLSAGCVSPWWNSFLNPTKLGNFRENRVTEILRSVSFRDKPAGIAGAEDPKPKDLIATVEPYEVGPGDLLEIRILDLLAPDTEAQFQPRVDELGRIVVSQIGRVHVEGLTAEEVEEQLKDVAIRKGIFAATPEPTIIVNVAQQRQRLFTLAGAIRDSGTYPIPKPDFRLREAITMGGGLDELVKTVYVFRNESRPKRQRRNGANEGPDRQEGGSETQAPAPPVTPMTMADNSQGGDPAATQEAEQELIEAVAPENAIELPQEEQPETRPQETAPGEDMAPSKPPFIFVNDRFIEAPTTQEAEQRAAEREAVTQPARQAGEKFVAEELQEDEEVDWEELVSKTQQRIIKIPAENLRKGDSDYNIVVEPGDWIRLEMGPTGNYYMMGEVRTPGFNRIQRYDFAGEEVTLRQAIASVGGLNELAWPTRCEIVRRLEGDREEITQWNLARIMDGRDPDVYLKPGDVVNVGTHAIARLLFNIRNGFRLNYGFSFSYDRNFADIDSFGPQTNPISRRRAEREQLFPGLF